MNTLHLITRLPVFEQLVPLLTPDDKVVLLSEAVYHSTAIIAALENAIGHNKIHVLQPDYDLRGLDDLAPENLITYHELVTLTLDAKRNITW